MLQKIVDRLLDTHKLLTSVQFGIDFELSKHFRDGFKLFDILDVESELSFKFEEQFNFKDSRLVKVTNVSRDFEFLEAKYDFAYIHNRFKPDISGKLLSILIRDDTPFILCHPTVMKKEHPKYKCITFKTEEGDFRLYYNDLTLKNINELFDA